MYMLNIALINHNHIKFETNAVGDHTPNHPTTFVLLFSCRLHACITNNCNLTFSIRYNIATAINISNKEVIEIIVSVK